MQLSNIPSKYNIAFASSAAPSYIRTIPQVPTGTAGQASLQTGFPPENFQPLSAGGVPPFGQDFNGLMNAVTAWMIWSAEAGGPIYFDGTFCTAIGGYPQGALLQSSTTAGLFWLSTADNNVVNPNSGPSTQWLPLSLGTDRWYAVDTGTTNNVIVTLTAPPPGGYFAGMRIDVKLANSFNGAAVINANGFGSKAITKGDLSAVGAGNGVAGEVLALVYDGTQFQVENILSTNFRANTYSVFSTHGTFTWTCPANVTQVKARMVGAGGAGGAGVNFGGGGGGNAGAYGEGIFSVTPGTAYTVVIGLGGVGGAGAGNTGGTTSFGSFMSITGGGGGTVGNGTGGTTSASSSASGASFTAQGSSGNYGSGNGTSVCQGGFGGGSIFEGPAFTPICFSGSTLVGATNNTGAAGSGGASATGAIGNGGSGGDGVLILEY